MMHSEIRGSHAHSTRSSALDHEAFLLPRHPHLDNAPNQVRDGQVDDRVYPSIDKSPSITDCILTLQAMVAFSNGSLDPK